MAKQTQPWGQAKKTARTSLALLLLAIAQNRSDDVADLILSLSRTTAESDEAGFVLDLRRKLPRYQWRSLEGIRTGTPPAVTVRDGARATVGCLRMLESARALAPRPIDLDAVLE